MALDGTYRLPPYFHTLMDAHVADATILSRADAESGVGFEDPAKVGRPGLLTRLAARLSRLSGLASCGLGAAACRAVQTYEACKKAARDVRRQVSGILTEAALAPAGAPSGGGERKALLSRRVQHGSPLMTTGEARRLLRLAQEEMVRRNEMALEAALDRGGDSLKLMCAIPVPLKTRWDREPAAVRMFFEAEARHWARGGPRENGSFASEPQCELTDQDIDNACKRAAHVYECLRKALPQADLGQVIDSVCLRGDNEDERAKNLVLDVREKLAQIAAQAEPAARRAALRARADGEGWKDAIRDQLARRGDLTPDMRAAVQRWADELPLHPALLPQAVEAIVDLGECFQPLYKAARADPATSPADGRHQEMRSRLAALAEQLGHAATAISCDYDDLRAWLLEAAIETASVYQGIEDQATDVQQVVAYARHHLVD